MSLKAAIYTPSTLRQHHATMATFQGEFFVTERKGF